MVNQIEFGQFVVDLRLRRLLKQGEPVKLDPKVFDTLEYLVTHAELLCKRKDLIDHVWQDSYVEDANLHRHISNLRSVLGKDSAYIETRHRLGYIFWPKGLASSAIDDSECPWAGLRVLQENDQRFLFGRDTEVSELLAKLDNNTLLAVVGSSGTGKSSLVRAGLIPALKRSETTTGIHWRFEIFKPGDSPLIQLAKKIITLGNSDFDQPLLNDLVDSFQSSSILAEALKRWIDSNPLTSRLLLIVDQFEELVTLCRSPLQRKHFIENLSEALSISSDRICVVLIIRTEFYSQDFFPSFWAQITENQFSIKPLSARELRETIENPAKLVGVEIERGLVEEILQDLGNDRGSLPLLSHTMELLFQLREHKRLTLNSYGEIKGVRGAIATHADSVYGNFSITEQRHVKHVMMSLTKVSDRPEHDVRRRKSLRDLTPRESLLPEIESVVQKLVDERLLSISSGTGDVIADIHAADVTVELCHEALIHHWTRLLEWLDENRSTLLKFEQVDAATREWKANNQDPELLFPKRKLLEADSIRTQLVDFCKDSHLEFLEASQSLANKQQRAENRSRKVKRLLRSGGVSLLLLVLLVLLASAWMMGKWREVKRQRDHANSLRTAAESMSQSPTDPELGLLLAIEAGKSAPSTPARTALRSALSRAYERRVFNGHQLQVISVAISTDGKLLLTGGADKEVRLWNVENGETIRVLVAHDAWVNWAAFSPNGKQIVTAGGDGIVKIWNTENGSMVAEFMGHHGSVQNAVFSPDGNRLLTAGDDGTARVWDIASRKVLLILSGHAQWINTAVYSKDGKLIATASGDATAMVWNGETGRRIAVLKDHKSSVLGAAFDAKGDRLITSSRDRTAIVWNVKDGRRMLQLIGHKGAVNSAEFSPDGKSILTASFDGSARIWDSQTGTELVDLRGHRSAINAGVFSPDGQFVFTASGDGTARMWAPWLFQKLTTLRGHSKTVSTAVFSSDGTLLLTAGEDGSALIWNTSDWKTVKEFRAQQSITRASFSPDNSLVATGGQDGKVRIWELKTSVLKVELAGHTSSVTSVAFSRDGFSIVTSSSDGTAIVWRSTGVRLRNFSFPAQDDRANQIQDVSFSPDGSMVAAACNDFKIRLWSVDEDTLLLVLNVGTGSINRLEFTRDGSNLLAACHDQTIRVWNMSDKQSLAVLRGHEESVDFASFSRSGELVLSGGQDRTIRLWDVRTKEMLSVIGFGDAPFTAGSISPDGKLITVGDQEGRIEVYKCAICDRSIQELLSTALLYKTRTLTQAEMKQFLDLSQP